MRTYMNPDKTKWEALLTRPQLNTKDLMETVAGIFSEVRANGDQAVKKYTRFFDKVEIDQLEVTKDEFDAARKEVSTDLLNAMKLAQKNIDAFHRSQVMEERPVETTPGVTCWRENRPIESVGLYIPGGSAPLFSTVLMLGIPAKIAGCNRIVLTTPPGKNGQIDPAILVAAELVGITKVFKIGGVQAIAAMTFGTETVPVVSKIFGPGNQYVTAAKQYATGFGAAIDMPAGPSEVMVIADDSAQPAYVAADLLSQAEHGADSQVILVCGSEAFSERVKAEIKIQMKDLPRKEIAIKAMENSKIIILDDQNAIVDLCNAYGPEHLIINTEDPQSVLPMINNAGSIFIGPYTPESAGDYASGTNHTLPTNGYARNYSGVSVDSFIKKITFQRITKEGLEAIGPAIQVMAEAEQLQAHRNAVSIRLNDE